MEKPYFIINSVVRTLNIIEYLGQKGEASVSDISNYFKVNKSTAHRFLASMKYAGFLEQNVDNQKYMLSFKLFEIGNKVLEGLNIREIAKPVMHELCEKTGETINLGILDKGDVVYIEKELSKNNLRLDCPIGGRDPIHSTALGKAIFAFQPTELIEEYIKGKGLIKKTPNTITDTKKFLEELENVRKNKYAIDNEGIVLGVFCIAVPIFDCDNKVIAAISVSTPTSRMNEKNFEEFKRELIRASQKLSTKLGAKL